MTLRSASRTKATSAIYKSTQNATGDLGKENRKTGGTSKKSGGGKLVTLFLGTTRLKREKKTEVWGRKSLRAHFPLVATRDGAGT